MKDLRRYGFGAAALVWLCVLVFFSSQSAAQSDGVSHYVVNGWFNWLVRLGVPFESVNHIVRKLAHASGFAIEGFLCYMSLSTRRTKKRALLVSAGACALFAVGNELQQLFSAGRSCEVRDMCIDFGGALCGMLFGCALMILINHRQRKGSTGETT